MIIDEHCDLASINKTYKNNSFRKIDNKEINQCSMPSINPPLVIIVQPQSAQYERCESIINRNFVFDSFNKGTRRL